MPSDPTVENINQFGSSVKEKEPMTPRQMAEAMLAEVHPLEDEVFKKFLECNETFREAAETMLERKIPDGQIISIQGEHVLFKNGRTIRLDNLRLTSIGMVNMEAQKKASKFPLKRHLYYWAASYMSVLQKGQDYGELQPAISIVVYDGKQGAKWRKEAKLAGSLVEDEDSLLTLVAINTAEWKNVPNTKAKELLALLRNGIYVDQKALKFEGIDVNSAFFNRMGRKLRLASIDVRCAEIEQKGDMTMTATLREAKNTRGLSHYSIMKSLSKIITSLFAVQQAVL